MDKWNELSGGKWYDINCKQTENLRMNSSPQSNKYKVVQRCVGKGNRQIKINSKRYKASTE